MTLGCWQNSETDHSLVDQARSGGTSSVIYREDQKEVVWNLDETKE